MDWWRPAGMAAWVLLVVGACSGPGVPDDGGGTGRTPSTAVSPTTPPPGVETSTAPVLSGFMFPVQAPATYSEAHHDYPATDVFAPCDAQVVAPFAGTVSETSTADRWSPGTNVGADRGGLSVTLVGADGVRFYGSHLSRVDVEPGQSVDVGDPLGLVGSTGSAAGTACHLHVGLSPAQCGPGDWWTRRGVVSPYPYLRAWEQGTPNSPADEVAAWHARHGCPTTAGVYP